MTTRTNTELVTHIMDFSKAGPLAQVFVIEAIRKYAEQIAANEDTVREQMRNAFIDGAAWINTARIVGDELTSERENG